MPLHPPFLPYVESGILASLEGDFTAVDGRKNLTLRWLKEMRHSQIHLAGVLTNQVLITLHQTKGWKPYFLAAYVGESLARAARTSGFELPFIDKPMAFMQSDTVRLFGYMRFTDRLILLLEDTQDLLLQGLRQEAHTLWPDKQDPDDWFMGIFTWALFYFQARTTLK
jgi:hypothetical protein